MAAQILPKGNEGHPIGYLTKPLTIQVSIEPTTARSLLEFSLAESQQQPDGTQSASCHREDRVARSKDVGQPR